MKNFVNKIIANATKLDSFIPVPRCNRFGIRTYVFCVDELPERFILKKEHELFWYNDRAGFFKSNAGNIVALCKDIISWDTGLTSDTELVTTSKENLGTIGNRICVRNDANDSIEVYKVVGYVSDGNSNYYFDVK